MTNNANNKLKLQYWPLEKLKPYAKNPRKNDQAVARMAKAIEEFGFTVPVLANSSGEVIDGHLRIKAAKALGIGTIPVVLADHMTTAQVKAFRLLANQSVSWAKWDMSLLREEISDLRLGDFDLSLTGFDDRFFSDMEIALKVEDKIDFGEESLVESFMGDPSPIEPFRPLSKGLAPGGESGDGYGDGGEGGGYGQGADPDWDAGHKVPLAIVLAGREHKQWLEYKRSVGAKSDTSAFLLLFQATRDTGK
jgi:hypothetical protein